jgi:hypothetical protein
MPVPLGTTPDLAEYLAEVEARVALLEEPQSPGPVFACTTANMPAAASYPNCVLKNTTLNILAVSDGTSWIRQDTGAVI